MNPCWMMVTQLQEVTPARIKLKTKKLSLCVSNTPQKEESSSSSSWFEDIKLSRIVCSQTEMQATNKAANLNFSKTSGTTALSYSVSRYAECFEKVSENHILAVFDLLNGEGGRNKLLCKLCSNIVNV